MYQDWRAVKLKHYRTTMRSCLVHIHNPHHLSEQERNRIGRIVSNNNFFIYQYAWKQYGNQAYQSICQQIGLTDSIPNPASNERDVTRIERIDTDVRTTQHRYIPYTDRRLGWHTDGYYNHADNQVRSFVLHCKQPALHGGENVLLDPEIAYILLRDQNPRWIQSARHPRCLTIPANIQQGKIVRRVFTGAMMETDTVTGQLHMRYTERKNQIQWRQDDDLLAALTYLKTALSSHNPWLINVRLEPGQGLIANNVLHCRSAFRDGDSALLRRCLYRIRFKERMGCD